ncbi:hypothetical protein HNQ91_001291 [Filimonas zeae]|nr:hypothetical protein [Filimonas zeae]MDR6338269.1 hypothetical protein [Filimonas zeae]
MYTHLLQALFLLLPGFYLFAQKPVTLPQPIANAAEEYSALATIKKQILLIPQYPDQQKTWSIPVKTVQKTIQQASPAFTTEAFTEVTLQNLPAVMARVNLGGNFYQGVEGAVAVNNTLFLSIETDEATDSCYLVKGYKQQQHIVLDAAHILALPKVKCNGKVVNNAGYESLTYNAATNQLLAVFEYTNVPDVTQTPIGYLADTLLSPAENLTPVYIQQPIPFRITDLCAGKNGQFYGINFWWGGEYTDYFTCNPQTPLPVKDSAQFRGPAQKLSCYGRVLQLQLDNQQLTWQPLQEIGYDCYNWEGIISVKNRLLVITDANKGKYLEKTTHVIVTDPVKQ